jgi:hypothetical protein
MSNIELIQGIFAILAVVTTIVIMAIVIVKVADYREDYWSRQEKIYQLQMNNKHPLSPNWDNERKAKEILDRRINEQYSSGHVITWDTSKEDEFFKKQQALIKQDEEKKRKDREEKIKEIERLRVLQSNSLIYLEPVSKLQKEYKNPCPPGHVVIRDLPREEKINKIQKQQRKQTNKNNRTYNLHIDRVNQQVDKVNERVNNIAGRLQNIMSVTQSPAVKYSNYRIPEKQLMTTIIPGTDLKFDFEIDTYRDIVITEEISQIPKTDNTISEHKEPADTCKGCGAFDYKENTCNYCGRKAF